MTQPLLPAKNPSETRRLPDSSFLTPENAFHSSEAASLGVRPRRHHRPRSRSRKPRGEYKKLLWFRQPFPDNYTDTATFLSALQRNPRLRPYEFWSLMADATVIVQHVASVVVFCCCFVAIFTGRVEPLVVVSWASGGTVVGWGVWDYWVGLDEREVGEEMAREERESQEKVKYTGEEVKKGRYSGDSGNAQLEGDKSVGNTPSVALTVLGTRRARRSTFASNSIPPAYQPPYVDPKSSLSPKNQQRLATAKSALLFFAAVLGLSPILKSLTKSTTSDSIWALSTCLLCMNVAFFDYSAGPEAELPASFSTNSALMASTVLASRLPSTTHVFSLTLFSIEVFGLFPIFRRQLRVKSWYGHLALTTLLIATAGGALFATLTGGGRGAWLAGVILGSLFTFLAMGICSWWLIGLQKYKNEITGPWDPAQPVLRRRWD